MISKSVKLFLSWSTHLPLSIHEATCRSKEGTFSILNEKKEKELKSKNQKTENK